MRSERIESPRPKLVLELIENRRQWEVWMTAGPCRCRIGSVYRSGPRTVRWRPWAGSKIDTVLQDAIMRAICNMTHGGRA